MSAFTEDTTASEVASKFSARIKGKVILITGASPNSLAETAALAIAAQSPALIILHGRSKAAIEETEKNVLAKNASVKTRILLCDLSSFASVRKGAAEINSYPENIDVIINSAGIMAAPFSKTVDGVESHFAVNHLAHFLLTNLVVGKLAKNAKILNVTSGGYALGGVRFDDVNFEVRKATLKRDKVTNHDQTESFNKWQAYAQSKTANILYSIGLADRLGPKGIFSYSIDIGGGMLEPFPSRSA